MGKKTIAGAAAGALGVAGFATWFVLGSDVDGTPQPDGQGMCHVVANRYERGEPADQLIAGVYEFKQNEGLLVQAPYNENMRDPACVHLHLEAFIPDPSEGSMTVFCRLFPKGSPIPSVADDMRKPGQARTFIYDLGCMPKDWAANDGLIRAACWRGSDTFKGEAHLHQAILSYPCGEGN